MVVSIGPLFSFFMWLGLFLTSQMHENTSVPCSVTKPSHKVLITHLKVLPQDRYLDLDLSFIFMDSSNVQSSSSKPPIHVTQRTRIYFLHQTWLVTMVDIHHKIICHMWSGGMKLTQSLLTGDTAWQLDQPWWSRSRWWLMGSGCWMTIPYSMIGLMSQGDLVVYPLKVKPIRHDRLRHAVVVGH
jgi:hypothetical protein